MVFQSCQGLPVVAQILHLISGEPVLFYKFLKHSQTRPLTYILCSWLGTGGTFHSWCIHFLCPPSALFLVLEFELFCSFQRKCMLHVFQVRLERRLHTRRWQVCVCACVCMHKELLCIHRRDVLERGNPGWRIEKQLIMFPSVGYGVRRSTLTFCAPRTRELHHHAAVRSLVPLQIVHCWVSSGFGTVAWTEWDIGIGEIDLICIFTTFRHCLLYHHIWTPGLKFSNDVIIIFFPMKWLGTGLSALLRAQMKVHTLNVWSVQNQNIFYLELYKRTANAHFMLEPGRIWFFFLADMNTFDKLTINRQITQQYLIAWDIISHMAVCSWTCGQIKTIHLAVNVVA